jgi:NADH:ubiquinone oxidoreductase subunit 6 (subunit J)
MAALGVLIVLIWVALVLVLPFVVADKIGKGKGRRGWIYALLGGWIGVIVLACVSPAVTVDPVLEAKERRIRELELDARIEQLTSGNDKALIRA